MDKKDRAAMNEYEKGMSRFERLTFDESSAFQEGWSAACAHKDAKCSPCKDDMEAAWLEREAILQAKHDEEMAEAVRIIAHFSGFVGPAFETQRPQLMAKADTFLAAHKEKNDG